MVARIGHVNQPGAVHGHAEGLAEFPRAGALLALGGALVVVMPSLLAAELKQAQVKAASEAAFASPLPQAAAVAALLEMIQVLRLALRGGPAGLPPLEIFGLAPSQRSGKDEGEAALLLCAAFGAALASTAALRRPQPALRTCRAPASEVLRC